MWIELIFTYEHQLQGDLLTKENFKNTKTNTFFKISEIDISQTLNGRKLF